MTGRSRLHQGGQSWDIVGPALTFCTVNASYTWESFDEQAGLFCEFAEAFIGGAERTGSLQSLPLFTPGASPVLVLTAEQAHVFNGHFQQLLSGLDSTYPFKYEVLRHQLHVLLHQARHLLPPPPAPRPATAADRLAAHFLDLLEQQFPIPMPFLPLRLRSAQDFAPLLQVHVNHLNRAVRAATGKTTTEHITARIVQEAWALLQHTDWSITDLAYALGFEYPTYFHNFFKKQTGRTPRQARAASQAV
ncbi:MAG: helix-turn-helix domain-containing protein [Janthinobacterium lividum]